MSFLSFSFLSLAIFSLPLHMSPASMGACILIIVVSLLTFFVSMNMTLAAIFITLVYISGILILFSYFFSLIQNSKIGFSSLAFGMMFSFLFLLVVFNLYFYKFDSKMFFIFTESFNKPFLWILMDSKLVGAFILVLLLSMLFIEKTIGLKQKPLRLK